MDPARVFADIHRYLAENDRGAVIMMVMVNPPHAPPPPIYHHHHQPANMVVPPPPPPPIAPRSPRIDDDTNFAQFWNELQQDNNA